MGTRFASLDGPGRGGGHFAILDVRAGPSCDVETVSILTYVVVHRKWFISNYRKGGHILYSTAIDLCTRFRPLHIYVCNDCLFIVPFSDWFIFHKLMFDKGILNRG